MKTLFLLLPLLLFTACSSLITTTLNNKSPITIDKTTYATLAGWQEKNHTKALEAFTLSCHSKRMIPALLAVCKNLPTTLSAKDFFETYFQPVIWKAKQEKNTITGYYEPLLKASRTRTKEFIYPVHSIPDDLLHITLQNFDTNLPNKSLRGRISNHKVIPYYTREEITKRNTSNVIAWVKDKVDLFFLQVQGSGRLQLVEDNTTLFVGYGDKNGYTYASIGKYMIKQKYMTLDQMSLQGIKKWAVSHPNKIDEVLNHNPSYLFFVVNKEPAKGAQGVVLTAQHSCAVDTNYIPLGLPLFIQTKHPTKAETLTRLTIAQDKGAAIKGKQRIDFFWGFGNKAGYYAGHTKSSGTIVLLLPKTWL